MKKVSKINWDDVKMSVEALYPAFRKYEKEYRGFLTCPACAEIKEWYEFLEFVEEVKKEEK